LPDRALQAVAGRGMAHAGAGIDIVVGEGCPHHLLHQERLLIGAAGRSDAADRVAAVLRLNAPQLTRRVGDRLFPGDLAPVITNGFADHRLEDAVRVRRVAVGETALHAGVALIGIAMAARRHAHDLGCCALAPHFSLEAAADAAIGAGRGDGTLRLTEPVHGLLHQGGGRTGFHTRTAGDAFGLEERLILTRRDLRREAAPLNRQREGALHLVAGTHAARADDAL